MKNIIAVCIMLISMEALVQASQTMQEQNNPAQNSIMNPVGQDANLAVEEGIIMQSNKMMLVQNGKMITMERDEKLTDGSTVSKMGMIQRPDGSTVQMQEGDFVKKTGMFVPGPKRNEEQNKQ